MCVRDVRDPARVWGAMPKKGAVMPGADADLTLVDLEYSWTSGPTQLRSKRMETPWADRWSRGASRTRIARGRELVRERQFVGADPSGEFVRPTGYES